MARVVKESHSSTCHPRFYLQMQWTIGLPVPELAFPVEAGTRLPTPEGWKTELA